MAEIVHLHWGVSRVGSDTIELSQDPERRCLDLSIMQVSILRQMVFPWAYRRDRLVEDFDAYQVIEEQPTHYKEALEELEELLSGAYDGPETGCPVGEVYVDRGDPNAWDTVVADLTVDGAYHDLSLAGIITDSTATRVLLRVEFVGNAAGRRLSFRKKGNANPYNLASRLARVANITDSFDATVSLGSGRSVSYNLAVGITTCNILVRGWWKPAA